MKSTKELIVVALILFGFSVLAGWKLFNTQFYTTHDGGGHVIRMEEFHAALNDGQFPVRIAKRINHGLGYPYFHFNYPLVYYCADVLHRAGLSFVEAFKTLLFVSVFIGGVFMYSYTRYFFSTFSSVISGILYIIVPYRFLNMYVRGTVGEAVGLALLPLVFFSVEYVLEKKERSSYPVIISLALLILSHNITALVGAILIAFYCLLRLKMIKKERWYFAKKLIISAVAALLLTLFFWFPALIDSGNTKLSELREDYQEFFPLFREVIYSPWGFGTWKTGLYPGKMSPQIGLVHSLVSVVSIALLSFNSIKKRVISKRLSNNQIISWFFAASALAMLFLSLEISKPIWDALPILQAVQHPWRFVGYILISVSVLSAYLFDWLKGYKLHILAVVALIPFLLYANRNHIRVNMYIDYISPFKDGDFVYALSTTSKDEHMPRFAPRVYETPIQDGEVFPEGAGKSKRMIWKSNYHRFLVEMEENGSFRDNTSYFPGWEASVDGKPATILYNEDQYKRLLVNVPKGRRTVEFFFKEPVQRKIVNTISLVTFAGLLAVLFYHVVINRKNFSIMRR